MCPQPAYDPWEDDPDICFLLSEEALRDWNRPEEDAAWVYLQAELESGDPPAKTP